MPGKEGESGRWVSKTREKEGEMGRADKWGNVMGIWKRRTEDLEELGEKSGIWSKEGTLMRGVMWTFRAVAGGGVRVQRSAKGRDRHVSIGPSSRQGWMSPCLHACHAINK